MRFALPLVALLFSTGPALATDLLPDAETPAAQAPASAPALRFAWPTPSRVTVTQRSLKKGKRAVLRYDAVLSARMGGGYELKLDKIQFLELEGRDVSKGPLPPEVKTALAMASALPTVVISAEGEFVDVMGLDEVVEHILKQTPNEKGRRDKIRAVFAQPAVAQAMKQKAGDFWQAWVGAWVGMDVAAGQERVAMVPLQMPLGSVDGTVTLRHRGPVTEHKGAVRLEMETVLEGEPFRKEMVNMLSQMVQAAGAQEGTEPPDFEAMLQSARRVSTVEVVTDPATLRPYSARMVQVTQVQVEDQQNEQREEQEYRFTWPAQKAGKRRWAPLPAPGPLPRRLQGDEG
jgi:hypothetical protein